MICTRCGYCCYSIPAHLPRGDSKMGHELCPYLTFDHLTGSKVAICTIYGEPNMEYWKNTPCGKFRTTYDNDPLVHARPCKMGIFIHSKGGLLDFVKNYPDLAFNGLATLQAMTDEIPIATGKPHQSLYRSPRPVKLKLI